MMLTALNQTLIRNDTGWYWSDGAPEPRISDLSASDYYNFRCRSYGSGSTFVEIPVGTAREEPDLHIWVERFQRGEFAISTSGDAPDPPTLDLSTRTKTSSGAPVMLIPIELWDIWAVQFPVGARWEKSDEFEILAKAESLGWKHEEM
jgi:hypothetical protein